MKAHSLFLTLALGLPLGLSANLHSNALNYTPLNRSLQFVRAYSSDGVSILVEARDLTYASHFFVGTRLKLYEVLISRLNPGELPTDDNPTPDLTGFSYLDGVSSDAKIELNDSKAVVTVSGSGFAARKATLARLPTYPYRNILDEAEIFGLPSIHVPFCAFQVKGESQFILLTSRPCQAPSAIDLKGYWYERGLAASSQRVIRLFIDEVSESNGFSRISYFIGISQVGSILIPLSKEGRPVLARPDHESAELELLSSERLLWINSIVLGSDASALDFLRRSVNPTSIFIESCSEALRNLRSQL